MLEHTIFYFSNDSRNSLAVANQCILQDSTLNVASLNVPSCLDDVIQILCQEVYNVS